MSALATDDAFVFDGSGGATKVTLEKAVSPPGNEAAPVWLRLNLRSPEIKQRLQKLVGLDSIIVEHLLTGSPHPRSLLFEKGLLLSLRAVSFNEERNPQDMVGIAMWLEEGLIITSQCEPIRAIADIEQCFTSGTGPCDTSQFLSQLINSLADNTEQTMDTLEGGMEELEEHADLDNMIEMRAQLTNLRRFVHHFKRSLTPQLEALNVLLADPPVWLNKRDRSLIGENIHRYNWLQNGVLFALERVRAAQEDLQNLAADRLNKRMYALTVASTVFLPLTFLTGLFGINVGGILWAHNANGFALFSLCMLFITVIQLLFFRWMKLL